jgi:carbon-monoxide dehydrogenase large subunit
MTFVGRSVTRLEDRPLVTGRGRFAADVAFPRMVHMRVVRSAHAHGRIVSIDTSAALALPGVVAIWTSADVSEIPPIDFRLTRIEGLAAYRQPILARQRVRYVGEPVAAVFATDPYVAEDAADLVAIAVEELPVVLDATAAPAEFEDGRSTEPAIVEKSYGDVGAAFREAHAVIELDLAIGRHSGVPLETRAMMPPATCWSFMAPPRCRTGIATTSPACWAAIPPACICSRAMSAAASVFAASFIPRTCWSALPRCGSVAQ